MMSFRNASFIFFVVALLLIVISFSAIFTNHLGFSEKIVTLIYLILSIATLFYLKEIKNEEK